MSEPLQIVSASTLDLEHLTHAFNRAFEGYPLPLTQTPDSLRGMMRANDIALDASVAALDAEGEPVGIGLLGVRGRRAWVGGMGVGPDWRGHGHGALIMRELSRRAHGAGVRRVQLEVLEENPSARKLYQRLGFNDERLLVIFTGRPSSSPSHVERRSDEEIRDLLAEDALDQFEELHACVAPCWQRERPSLRNMAPGLRALGLFGPEGVRAYILYSHVVNAIGLLDAGARALEPAERARAIGLLVGRLLDDAPGAVLRAINVPPGDPLGDVMTVLGCAVVARQHEMALALPN